MIEKRVYQVSYKALVNLAFRIIVCVIKTKLAAIMSSSQIIQLHDTGEAQSEFTQHEETATILSSIIVTRSKDGATIDEIIGNIYIIPCGFIISN